MKRQIKKTSFSRFDILKTIDLVFKHDSYLIILFSVSKFIFHHTALFIKNDVTIAFKVNTAIL